MRHACLLAATLMCLTAVPVQTRAQRGESSDGNHLLPQCQAALNADAATTNILQSLRVGFCFGLVEGIAYAAPSVCATKGVTVEQLTRIVVKFLEDNPEKLNLDERELVVKALSKAFPCAGS